MSRAPRTVDGLDRNAIVSSYYGKVQYLAQRLARRIPSGASLAEDDLVSYGAIGLLEAFDRYSPAQDIKFGSYAEHRIRGAMLDALRAVDPLSRNQRSLVRRVEKARRSLARELGRDASDAEVGRRVGASVEQVRAAERYQQAGATLSTDLAHDEDGGEGTVLAIQLEGSGEAEVLDALLREGTTTTITRALACIPERSRVIVERYYLQGHEGQAIAADLGISKARVSQLLSRARGSLRACIEGEAARQGLQWHQTIGEYAA
jgi:RNA polymerase sigma factor for flagellar operon FliA